MAKYTIALPVMLHKQEEIDAFCKAKERIEHLYHAKGSESDVQVFLYLHPPPATKRENFQRQIENQQRYKIPIAHVQLPVQGTNSLDYDADEARQFGIPGRLEEIIDHAADLVYESNILYGTKPDFDIHPGVLVVPGIEKEHPAPGVYSIEGFLKKRKEIIRRVKARFSELNRRCNEYGVNLILETEPVAVFEPLSVLERRTGLAYLPFADPFLRKEISSDTTFDSAHFAATKNVRERFAKNCLDPNPLFNVLGINSWEDHDARFGKIEPYLSGVKALHLGNTTGIGVHLSDKSEIERWGNGGTEGTLKQEDFHRLKKIALKENLPMVIEVEYDIENIPRNCFIEADSFLKEFNLV